MSDDHSWRRGLKRWLSTAPETRDDLLNLVQDSRRFLDSDMVDMLEGVLDLPAMAVKEIMTPRPDVRAITSSDGIQTVLATIFESNHSRYPVIDEADDNAVMGILLVKDLIPYLVQKSAGQNPPFLLKDLVRKPLYISETARSDTLLRSLQRAQVHMAVVVDEFGSVSGVATLEDLLEEIVGDIVDEHDDIDEDSTINNIITHPEKDGVWLVQASTLIGDCNEVLGTSFDDTDVDTMGGLVMQALGAVSNLQGQSVSINDWQITVVDVEGRYIHLLELTLVPQLNDGG
ncbi:transporter associated domain-containing protein [Moraxella nonliquefaciens]|jgi:magnesium and cobalt efflux protein corC|uniref:Magnesium and cobalt efflux protein CorC n=1 Tax=Moraxella nonliquefaciens TaxID=478 RepID=A0A1B8PIL6_MORNO|nr:transporter associated domain-containing protein [Moraxella nonliquefaciens]MCG7412403.1 CBS domain-containing protein [Moraxella nonliquefaciens]MDI4498680.1 CBS domain-containing protein [Moraxella nonliquefaciens]MDI4500372.1 CBS domain-containing protein [Moraxella nonliquefaciens]OBX48886.1 magnesium/cobalt efflux protein [Moraxella nonliquefaciens]OBX86396.1 magnesium/cobalt efflux protein [Moraxella nonliquefaciens]